MRMGVTGVVALALLTAACGTNTQQRAASGGLAGLGVGALVGGPVGAIVGAAAGSLGGWAMPEGAETLALNAIHKEKNVASGALSGVGLGGSSGSSQASQSQSQLVREAQSQLQREGLYRGPIDGIVGPETKQALAAYQAREGLQQTASLDEETLQRMNLPSASERTAQSSGAKAPSGSSTPMMSADEVRERLQSAGYDNVSNLRQQGQRYTARAERSNDTYALRIDGHTGKVVSEQRLASNQGHSADTSGTAGNTSPSASSGSTSPAGSSTSPSPGSSTSTSTETGTTSGR